MIRADLLQFDRLDLGGGYFTSPYEFPGKLPGDIIHHKNETTLESYRKVFSAIHSMPTRLLEVGIQNGGSLCLWHEVFTGCDVTGMDVDLSQLQSEFLAWNYPKKVRIVLVDCRHRGSIASVADKVSPLDIIIDDGAHDIVTISNCFIVLWPCLVVGGLYFIEDYAALHEIHQAELIDVLRSYKGASITVYSNFLFLEKSCFVP